MDVALAEVVVDAVVVRLDVVELVTAAAVVVVVETRELVVLEVTAAVVVEARELVVLLVPGLRRRPSRR